MNIPYFSIITTPVMSIMMCLLIFFVGALLYGIQDMFIKVSTKLMLIPLSIIRIFLTIFIVWLLIGDPLNWPELLLIEDPLNLPELIESWSQGE